jgi:hypothetical protein
MKCWLLRTKNYKLFLDSIEGVGEIALTILERGYKNVDATA